MKNIDIDFIRRTLLAHLYLETRCFELSVSVGVCSSHIVCKGVFLKFRHEILLK